ESSPGAGSAQLDQHTDVSVHVERLAIFRQRGFGVVDVAVFRIEDLAVSPFPAVALFACEVPEEDQTDDRLTLLCTGAFRACLLRLLPGLWIRLQDLADEFSLVFPQAEHALDLARVLVDALPVTRRAFVCRNGGLRRESEKRDEQDDQPSTRRL